MEITGQCYCGEIAYRATIDPKRVAICHCRDCQIFSGSAFRMAGIAEKEGFAFTRGTPRMFAKISERGFKRHMAFCGTCGTHICAMPDPDSDLQWITVRVSSSDQFSELRPSIEAFCCSKVEWLPPLEGMAQYDRMRPR